MVGRRAAGVGRRRQRGADRQRHLPSRRLRRPHPRDPGRTGSAGGRAGCRAGRPRRPPVGPAGASLHVVEPRPQLLAQPRHADRPAGRRPGPRRSVGHDVDRPCRARRRAPVRSRRADRRPGARATGRPPCRIPSRPVEGVTTDLANTCRGESDDDYVLQPWAKPLPDPVVPHEASSGVSGSFHVWDSGGGSSLRQCAEVFFDASQRRLQLLVSVL